MSHKIGHVQWALNRGATLLVVLFLMNLLGITNHLYWMVPWYDSVTHFLGGVVIGFLSLYGCYKLDLHPFNVRSHAILFVTMVWVAFLGWEVFEYIFQSIGTSTDTLWDLFFDNLGAFLAFQWFRMFGLES